MATFSNEPFSLDEIKGVLEIYEGLHGEKLGRSRFQVWLEGRLLTEEAYDFICTLYGWRKK